MVLIGRHQIVPVRLNPVNKRLDTAEARSRFDRGQPGAVPVCQPHAAHADARPPHARRRWPSSSTSSWSTAAPSRGSTTPAASTARSAPSTTARSTSPRRCRRWSSATRTSAASAACSPTTVRSRSSSTIVNTTYPEGKTAYNAVAEIPGSDKAQEVVMLGAHLDSWHAATGATDNGIGSAVMMEAARILKAIGVKPRRTIRVALWSGEEQGLLGSKAYVKEHFGTAEEPKPEYDNFAGYINIDTGTGRIRGLTVFGPDEAGDGPAQGRRAVCRPRRGRRDHDEEPSHRRHRPHVVQRRGPARHRHAARSDGIPVAHLAHQPRHLRADRRRRREDAGGGDRRRWCTSWRCATRCCRGSRRRRCRRPSRRRPRRAATPAPTPTSGTAQDARRPGNVGAERTGHPMLPAVRHRSRTP